MTSARTNGIALLVILTLLTSCGSYFDGSVTSYPIGKADTGAEIPLDRTAYKASFDAQTVVYWMPGSNEIPEKLINCTVRDKYNWKGEYPGHSGEVQMRDGEIVNRNPNIRYSNSFYWHLLKLK